MKKLIVLGVFLLIGVSLIVWRGTVREVAGQLAEYFYTDPDTGPFLNKKGGVTKEEFMTRRAEGAGLKRGIVKDQPFDRSLRPAALKQLETQKSLVAKMPASPEKNSLLSAWTEIGPAPIPNSQVETPPITTASGRVTAIAVHPTNPDIVYVGAAQGGVYRTTDGGTNWNPIFDSAQSLAVGAIAIAPSSPETVYIGTGEPNFSSDSFFGVGIYRIDNASTTATLNGPFNQTGAAADIFTGRAIGEIIVHPTDPATIFVGSTSGIGGLVAASGGLPNRGIYRSTNATSASPTFAQLAYPFVNQNLSCRDLAIDPDNPDVLIANVVANGGGILRTTNALAATPTFTLVQTFSSTSTSELTAEFAVVQPAAVSDATFYAATGNLGGRVLRSVDGGATWTQQIDNNFCTPQCFYDIAVDADPTNVNNVYLGGSPTLVFGRSSNGGTTFTADGVNFTAGLHVDTHAIAVAPSNPQIVYLGTDGGIYKTTNVTATPIVWTSLNNTQFAATQFMGLDIHPTDPDFSIGGTQDNGTNMYCLTCIAPHTPPWRRVDFGDGGYAVIDQNAPDLVNVRMYHTYFNAGNLQGYGTVAATTSASDSLWSFRGCQTAGATVNGITCNGVVNFYAPLERGPGNPNTIYYGSDRLYRSDNTGLNHTVVSQNPIVSGVPISAIGISPQNDNVRIVGLNNGAVFGTSTGAVALTDLDTGNAIPNVAIARTIVDPSNSNTAYVTLSAFGQFPVWRTANLSSATPTWTNASGSGLNALPLVPVNAIVVDPLDPARLYVGTDIGVYTSADSGANWLPYGTGLPRVAVFDIAITNALPRQLRIATHGRGLWQAAAIVAPTAAGVSITGRVTDTGGAGIRGAIVRLTAPDGTVLSAATSSFGYYRFEDVEPGQSYVATVSSRRYRFESRLINVSENVADLNFTAQ